MASAKTSDSVKGKVIFSRADQDEGASDIWDDSALIKAYDNAMAKMKGIGTDDHDDNEKTKDHKHGSRKYRSKKSKTRHWRAGDYCRAVYSADGQVYNGTILSIDDASQTCRVQYLDYDEVDEHPLTELKHAKLRRNRSGSESGSVTSDVMNDHTSSQTSHINPHQHQQQQSHNNNNKFAGHSSSMPPPPPPGPHSTRVPPYQFPPWAGNRLPSSMPFIPPPPPPPLADDQNDTDSEAMCSMLMSWYMSGYHTGYYQGLREGKKQASQSQSPYR